MQKRPKIFSILNLSAILIPTFFLEVLLSNPDFGDPLLLVALLGFLLMFPVLITGLIFILFKKSLQISTDYYFAFGILALCAGISGIICEFFQGFIPKVFSLVLALSIIGIYIITDCFNTNNKSI